MRQIRYVGGFFGAAILAGLFVGSVYAVPSLSQGYTTSDEVAVGGLVSLVKDSADTVNAATRENADNLLGIVVSGASSPLSLGTGTSGEVQVATNGSATALVSTINGEINQGDQITASPIAGIGMRATSNSKVIGVAQAAMTKTTDQTINDGASEREVSLGSVPVLISVSYHYATPEKTIIPAAVQNVANALAGREVRPLPIILSVIVFAIMMVVVMSIVFAMIRSSIVSVGRNPLAQSAVYRDVIQLSGVVLVIIASGITAIYLILRML